FAITSNDAQNGSGGVPLEVTSQLNELPELSDAAGFGVGPFLRVKDDGTNASGLALITDPVHVANLLKLNFTEGSWSDVKGPAIAVQEDKAHDEGWTQGSTFNVIFTDGTTGTLQVGAIYSDKVFSTYMADQAEFAGGKRQPYDVQIVADSAPGVSTADA